MVFITKIEESNNNLKRLSKNAQSKNIEIITKNYHWSEISWIYSIESGQRLFWNQIYGKIIKTKWRLYQKQNYF